MYLGTCTGLIPLFLVNAFELNIIILFQFGKYLNKYHQFVKQIATVTFTCFHCKNFDMIMFI